MRNARVEVRKREMKSCSEGALQPNRGAVVAKFGCGQWRGLARVEHILPLRCVVLNGQWDDFMQHVVQQAHSVGLREQQPPGLGRTHNAKRKQAA